MEPAGYFLEKSMTMACQLRNVHASLERKVLRCLFQLLFAGLVLLMLQSGGTFAQTDQGAITGVVQDSSGAVVPGASVTLTSTDTQFTMKTRTDGSGIFVLSPVKIGRYNLSASATGFQTTVQQNLQLNIQERLNVNLSLKPGAMTETITVSRRPACGSIAIRFRGPGDEHPDASTTRR